MVCMVWRQVVSVCGVKLHVVCVVCVVWKCVWCGGVCGVCGMEVCVVYVWCGDDGFVWCGDVCGVEALDSSAAAIASSKRRPSGCREQGKSWSGVVQVVRMWGGEVLGAAAHAPRPLEPIPGA